MALLNLFDGKKLTSSGLDYLKIYGANIHDQNKISKDSYINRIE
jgi:DNA-directed RNA polymerase